MREKLIDRMTKAFAKRPPQRRGRPSKTLSFSDFPAEVDKACVQLGGRKPPSLASFCAFALSWLAMRGNLALTKARHREWRVVLDSKRMAYGKNLPSVLANAVNKAAEINREVR